MHRRSSHLCAMAAATALAAVASAGVSQSYGTLSYPDGGSGSTEIDFTIGTGIGNSNFVFTNQQHAGQWLTLGFQTMPYWNSVNGIPQYMGDGQTFQVGRGYNRYEGGSALPTGPRWGFQWSVTLDGAAPTQADDIYVALRIDGPDGNWGNAALAAEASQVGIWQNSQNLAFDYYQLDSASYPGVGVPGLWDGLAFDPNTLGTYDMTLTVYHGDPMSGGSVIGTVAMSVEVVPGAGSIAGLAAIAGIRRRRRR